MDTQGKRLRLLYPDLHGLERGKYLFGDRAPNGHAAFCIGVYPLTHDKEILPVPRTQFDVGLHDIEATLDRDTLRPGGRRTRSSASPTSISVGSPPRSTRGTSCGRPSSRGAGWAWSRRSRSNSSSTCWSPTRREVESRGRRRRTASTAPACPSTRRA